jgi:hypothetical protein
MYRLETEIHIEVENKCNKPSQQIKSMNINAWD